MKKIFVLMAIMAAAVSASAQFEKGTHYGEASLTGLGLGYSHNNFAIGFGTGYGYFVQDGWMLGGRLGFNHAGSNDNRAQIQGLFRYSFQSNGINLGCGLQYEHAGDYLDYVQLCPQVGYTFYLGRHLSIEPAIYSDICMNDIKYGTNFGLKIGLGLYCKPGSKAKKSTAQVSKAAAKKSK